MGTWNFTYDAVDRLMSATAGAGAPSPFAGLFGCWTYDSFGNRTLEAFSTAAPTSCGQGANAQYTVTTPTANNRVSGFQYDAAGNVLYDNQNSYLYDAEGRLCAYAFPIAGGGTGYYQFLYDAEGARVAKGSLTSWPSSCQAPTAANGFALYSQYLLGLGGEPVTQLDGSGNANYSNVFVGGQALATYVFTGAQGLHFNLTDPLGTKRAQVSATGAVELNCLSLPYGDGLSCSTPPNASGATYAGSLTAPTEHHFTDKERDAESGNDYFGARYYSSAMGRFMSPDWSAKVAPVPYARLDNPQTLNLYAYLRNNPLAGIDADGHCNPNDWGCNPWTGSGSHDRMMKEEQEQEQERESQNAQQKHLAQGSGFWSGLKQGFSNLLHGHLWNYVKTSVSAFIANTWDAKDPSVTVVTDIAGAVGITAPKISGKLHLGPLSAGASIWNDHSLQNITINLLGLTEAGEGLVIPSLVVDYMKWAQPVGPEEPMGWDFSIPKEPVPSGLDTYDGGSEASGGITW
ncbi:MAG: RHS repeat-associated core domain-containing protein [Terracidiphilus sp.]